ncbi:Surfeit locus protein 1 [Orchesella cincta]|uniref:SURF1-like protein n=1 Tax=Orchesella cincta TaxID=48709 RepID=A0A1D2NIC1_ORCCI|nr:Surfeit locus protein 1 [Orchesella cincta]
MLKAYITRLSPFSQRLFLTSGQINHGVSTVFLPRSTRISVKQFSLTHSSFITKAHGNQSPSISTAKRSSQPDGSIPAGGWFLLIIPVSTLALGLWQVFRWRWKLGLMEEMRNISIADPVPLPQDLSDIETLECRKVKVKGEFDYSKQVLIGPRPLVYPDAKESDGGRGVFSGSGVNGYHIITSFKLEERNESILVNRGWVDTRNVKKYDHVDGPVEIVGIVRKTENRAPFMPKNRPGQNLLHYRDVPGMSQTLDTDEVFLDLYSVQGVDFSKARSESIPVPRQTRVTLRNEHVSYFITWFSLSAITSVMWHRRFIRRLNLL